MLTIKNSGEESYVSLKRRDNQLFMSRVLFYHNYLYDLTKFMIIMTRFQSAHGRQVFGIDAPGNYINVGLQEIKNCNGKCHVIYIIN